MNKITKPEPETTGDYIIIRIKNPNLFEEGSFRTIDISKSKGIKATIGRLKGETSTTVQRYLFIKTKWTLAEAEAWVKEHEKFALYDLIKMYEEIDISGKTDNKIIKFYKAKITNINPVEHTAKVYVTNEDIDRDNEINLITSWKKNLKFYIEHPVLVSSHKYDNLLHQIGEAAKEITFDNNGMGMDFKWYTGEGNPEADWGWKLAEKGMAMFSVGYRPIEVWEGDAIPEKYRDKNPRRVYAENELYEVSQVIIGSNRGALQMNFVNPNIDCYQYVADVVKTFGDEMPDLENIIIITEKGIIPFKSYPLADEDIEWDAGKEIKEAEIDDLKIICAWYDSENSDIKNSYKLPHHQAKGYKTVWAGVRAAMGVILGARGGVNIPTGDKKGVYNHLSKHYKEFEKEIPEMRDYTDGELKQIFGIENKSDNKIYSDDIFLPLKLDDNLIEQLKILKSGRVISEKNKTVIQTCIDTLQKSIELLSQLLNLSNGQTETGGDEDKSNSDKDLQIEINNFINRNKGGS